MLRQVVLFAGLAFAAAFSGAPALNGMVRFPVMECAFELCLFLCYNHI